MGLLNILRSLFGAVDDRDRESAPSRPPEPVVADDRPAPPPPSKSDKYLSAEEAAYYFVPDADGNLPVRIRRGFFYHPGTRKSVPPGNGTLSKHGLRSFAVRGVSYYPGNAKAANTSPGEPAILRREPNNKHDENAVAICGLDRTGTERRIGYVSKGRAKSLAKRMDAGEEPPEAYFMRGSGWGVEARDGIAVVLCDRETLRRLMR